MSWEDDAADAEAEDYERTLLNATRVDRKSLEDRVAELESILKQYFVPMTNGASSGWTDGGCVIIQPGVSGETGFGGDIIFRMPASSDPSKIPRMGRVLFEDHEQRTFVLDFEKGCIRRLEPGERPALDRMKREKP